jgi:hypothetical protein
VELTRPVIRTTHPMHELGDRLGVPTPSDYAAPGVIVHAHAAALLTAMAGTGKDGRSATAEPLIAGILYSGAV